MKRKYGYTPDALDHRDHLYGVKRAARMPKSVDLTDRMPPVVDQGQLGSCTGNGIAAVVDFLHAGEPPAKAAAKPVFTTSSRLQIYYDERVIENTVKQDAGAQIRDGIKVVNKTGAALESVWPYDIKKFATKPDKATYTSAATRKVSSYQRILSLVQLKTSLAEGFPVVFGFSVPASFESDQMAKTGRMTWNKAEQVVGGHCVVAVGYDDTMAAVRCRNSWGVKWGIMGYFWMPYDFIGDPSASSDFWTVRA